MSSLFIIFKLKKEQELQKQRLWHTFQEKNKQLELQHKWQLEHKFQVSILALVDNILNFFFEKLSHAGS